jgi:hypothetical protein
MLTKNTIEDKVLEINVRKMRLDAAFGGEEKNTIVTAERRKTGTTPPGSPEKGKGQQRRLSTEEGSIDPSLDDAPAPDPFASTEDSNLEP